MVWAWQEARFLSLALWDDGGGMPFLEQYKVFIVKPSRIFTLVHEVMGNNNVAPEIMLFHIQKMKF